jgi:hypothetical protein
MTKWFILAAGVFLLFNGMMSRTYSYTSEPVTHCFNMDYIKVFGCFGNPAVPHVITWGAALLGAGLIAWAVIHGRRLKA